ncbi:hypothetical protein [Salinimicrobium sp. GXAS 041]|uniref:hypothetical protein n=1 Tax=Salinimicrobium sp. GXAS 041 TaxID=3400806 RepID=UPI003C767186
MVRIINYKERVREDGEPFFVLELQGGIQMVKSQQTNKFYVTAKKATIPSTFDEITCKALIGTELPGTINKVQCDLYEYTIKDTGEVIQLDYRYEYSEEKKSEPIQEEDLNRATVEDILKMSNTRSFSANGVE